MGILKLAQGPWGSGGHLITREMRFDCQTQKDCKNKIVGRINNIIAGIIMQFLLQSLRS